MTKPVIAIDCDEVLMPHFEDLISWFNDEYGTHLMVENKNSMDPKPWGTDSVEEAIKRVHRFFETPMFTKALPFEDAVLALNQLKVHFDLVLLTARDVIFEEVTHDWLEENLPYIFQKTYFTSKYSLEKKSRSKGKVAKEIGAKYLIDDDLHNVVDAVDNGLAGILFGNYPWNQADDLPSGIVRCHNWADVLEYFDGKR